MKILVTGSEGYIGRHVVNFLTEKTDNEIMTIDVVPSSRKNTNHFQKNFLQNAEDKDLYESLGSPDVVIHLAWKDGFNHNSDEHLKNLDKHYLFLKNMIDSGCKSISVMGSMHEVGYFEGEINADTPCNPLSLYGIAKNALRQAIFNYTDNKDVSVKWLRAYYITGDDKKNKSIFAKILQLEEEGKETFPFVDGKAKYDFIDINELGKQIAVASIQNEYEGIINVCSGNPVSLKDKVSEFIEKNNLKIRPEYGVFPTRKYDSPIVFGNTEIINKIINSNK